MSVLSETMLDYLGEYDLTLTDLPIRDGSWELDAHAAWTDMDGDVASVMVVADADPRGDAMVSLRLADGDGVTVTLDRETFEFGVCPTSLVASPVSTFGRLIIRELQLDPFNRSVVDTHGLLRLESLADPTPRIERLPRHLGHWWQADPVERAAVMVWHIMDDYWSIEPPEPIRPEIELNSTQPKDLNHE